MAIQAGDKMPAATLFEMGEAGPGPVASADVFAGKTVAMASPSCYPSNLDRLRIREMAGGGASLDEILSAFDADRGPEAIAIPLDEQARRTSWLVPAGGMAAGVFLIVGVIRRLRGQDSGAVDGEMAVAAAGGADGDVDDALLAQLRDDVRR